MHHCEGCYDFNPEVDYHSCALKNSDGKCPCTVCIIKMICKTVCEKREEWYKSTLESNVD